MMPTSSSPLPPTLSRSSASIPFTERISSRVAIIGNMTRSLLPMDARKIARNWVRSSSGLSSPTRTPRTPRNGFSSRGMGR